MLRKPVGCFRGCVADTGSPVGFREGFPEECLEAECKRDLRMEDWGAFHVLEGRGQGVESGTSLGHVCGVGFYFYPKGVVGGAHLGLRKGWEMIISEFWKGLCGSLCGEGLWEPRDDVGGPVSDLREEQAA